MNNNRGLLGLLIAVAFCGLVLSLPASRPVRMSQATATVAANLAAPALRATVIPHGTDPTAIPEENFDENEVYQGVPGLVCVWSDRQNAVVCQEPRLAFRFHENEVPHPALSPEGLRAHYYGVLNVQKPGSYRFSATGSGKLTLKINGTVVLDTELDAELSQPTEEWTQLDFGPSWIEAVFVRSETSPPALRTFWERQGDFREPISALQLRHNLDQDLELRESAVAIYERGREVFTQSRCDACHSIEPDHYLARRSLGLAPDLTNLGKRIQPGWLLHWLGDPQSLQPHAQMPDLFGEGDEEFIDRFAVTRYLTRDQAADTKATETDPATGRNHFEQTGCIACHTGPDEPVDETGELRSLVGLGSKLSASAIREKMAEPKKHFASSRMPDFELDRDSPETLDALAAYLAQSRKADWETMPPSPEEAAIVSRLKELQARITLPEIAETDDPVHQLGQFVLVDRGCVDCHKVGTLKSQTDAPPRYQLAAKTVMEDGCLAEQPREGLPHYHLSAADRQAVAAVIRLPANTWQGNAPFLEKRYFTRQLGCTACHEVDGRESVFTRRIARFIPQGSDKTAKDLSPPALTGVGEKLHPQWLHDVIVDGRRARPWMSLKMPVFDRQVVASLPDTLIRSDGQTAEETVLAPVSVSDEEMQAAREMVGRNVFNCVSCHDVLGHQGTGTRGPDLAGVTARVRKDWFRRWLLDPQRLSPGTRMPSIFANGRSMAPQFLNGEPDKQIDALWAYFSQGSKMQLPLMKAPWEETVAGGEDPHFTPQDRPVLLRGFMVPYAGLRAVALGFPEKVHFAFDSQRCTLTTVWAGDFAKIGGWTGDGRGTVEENGISILGEILWQTGDIEMAAVLKRTNESDFEQALSYTARYDGCWASASDAGFAYRLLAGTHVVQLEQRPAPLPNVDKSAFRQRYDIKGLGPDLVLELLVMPLEAGSLAFYSADAIPKSPEQAADVDKCPAIVVTFGSRRWLIRAEAPAGARWKQANARLASLFLQLPGAEVNQSVTLSYVPLDSEADIKPVLESLSQ